MNKEELIKALEAEKVRDDFCGECPGPNEPLDRAPNLVRQLDEPVTTTSAPHLSEQMKTVQEALEFYVFPIQTAVSGNIGNDSYGGIATISARPQSTAPAKLALSLLPAIIEGVRGMEAGVGERIAFKAGDTHCEDCPCRIGMHICSPQPVPQVSAEVVDELLDALRFYRDAWDAHCKGNIALEPISQPLLP